MADRGVNVNNIVSQWFVRSAEIVSGPIEETLGYQMVYFVNVEKCCKKKL